jgi:hypothetical protein
MSVAKREEPGPEDLVLELANEISNEYGGGCYSYDMDTVEIVFGGALAYARQQCLPPAHVAERFLAVFDAWVAILDRERAEVVQEIREAADENS